MGASVHRWSLATLFGKQQKQLAVQCFRKTPMRHGMADDTIDIQKPRFILDHLGTRENVSRCSSRALGLPIGEINFANEETTAIKMVIHGIIRLIMVNNTKSKISWLIILMVN